MRALASVHLLVAGVTLLGCGGRLSSPPALPSNSSAPVVPSIERHAGHGSADLVKQTVEGGADAFAFLVQDLAR